MSPINCRIKNPVFLITFFEARTFHYIHQYALTVQRVQSVMIRPIGGTGAVIESIKLRLIRIHIEFHKCSNRAALQHLRCVHMALGLAAVTYTNRERIKHSSRYLDVRCSYYFVSSVEFHWNVKRSAETETQLFN